MARTKTPPHALRLAALMEREGLSDERLSIASNVSARTIAAVRLGRTKTIRPVTADALARALSALTGGSYSGSWLRGEAGR
jgi:transcriptional regulator with XRE-family HTH domain